MPSRLRNAARSGSQRMSQRSMAVIMLVVLVIVATITFTVTKIMPTTSLRESNNPNLPVGDGGGDRGGDSRPKPSTRLQSPQQSQSPEPMAQREIQPSSSPTAAASMAPTSSSSPAPEGAPPPGEAAPLVVELPADPFSAIGIDSWPSSANGPHTAIFWPFSVHSRKSSANGLPSVPVEGQTGSAWLGKGGLMLARPCEQYSVGCFGLDAALRLTRLWRQHAVSTTTGKEHLYPWLENSDKFAKWVSPVNPEYRDVHIAALKATGLSGLYDAMSLSRPENAAGVSYDRAPMVGEVGAAVVHPEGRLLVQGRDGSSTVGLITGRCSLSGATADALNPGSTNMVDAPVIVTSQHMCNGPAHFLMECFIRMFLVATAAEKLGAKVHVAAGSPMTKNFLSALGVEESRLVTGWVKSKRVLVPEGTDCGNPSTANLHLMRRWARAVSGTCQETGSIAPGEEHTTTGTAVTAQWTTYAREMDNLLERANRAETGSTVISVPPSATDKTQFCPYSGLDLGGAIAALGVEQGIEQYVTAAVTSGVDKDQAVKLANCMVAAGGDLIVPSASGNGEEAARPIRVLVIRRSGSRSIANEAALLEAIARDKDTVSSVSVFVPKGPAEDLTAFANADVVVAPHGAGLANIVACPPWAHVIELLARPTNIMYGTISVRLAMKWHAFLPASQGGGDATHAGAPMKADVAAIIARVNLAAAEIAAVAKDAANVRCTID